MMGVKYHNSYRDLFKRLHILTFPCEDVPRLFCHILTTSYFTFNGQFYGQTDGVAMGSPFSPVIANFYTDNYGKAALESAPLNPHCLFHYVDNIFVIWPHGPNKLKDFLHHLNSIPNQFSSPWKPKVNVNCHSWTQTYTEDWMAL
jgi:hypothetical protein